MSSRSFWTRISKRSGVCLKNTLRHWQSVSARQRGGTGSGNPEPVCAPLQKSAKRRKVTFAKSPEPEAARKTYAARALGEADLLRGWRYLAHI